jgi:murein DD-endopeptidase MepM/ murein hydrolase activator NlpD
MNQSPNSSPYSKLNKAALMYVSKKIVKVLTQCNNFTVCETLHCNVLFRGQFMSVRKSFATCLFFCVLCALSNLTFAGGYALKLVIPGDSLGKIAERYNISVDSLIAYNALTSQVLQPGDIVKVPYVDATGGAAEAAPKPPTGFKTYTLQEGETFSDVVTRYGLTTEALVGANPDISSLDTLPVGVELLIPPSAGLVITLQRGEDVGELLKTYNISPLEFMQANKIQSPLELRPGKLLFLPGVKPQASLDRLAKVREEENRYLWPVQGRITSYFGRRNLGMGTASFHRAIDIAVPTGTPITAARSGTVIYADWSNHGYGNLVKIQHSGGDETWYAHQSEILVSVGQYVKQSEVIGLVGSTGLSTGPHLHFELHEAGTAVDPLAYLK